VSPVQKPVSLREQRKLNQQHLSRAQILDAAEDVFARKGFHDATIKEIASMAEFSVGAVYLLFESKEDVFVQIYVRRGAEFMAGMRAVLSALGGPLEKVRRLATYEIEFFRKHANFGRLFLRSTGVTLGDLESKIDQAVTDNFAEAMNLQAKLFGEGQETGELRDGDPEVLAYLFSGLVSAFQTVDPVVATGGGVNTERMAVNDFLDIVDAAFRR
jgi:TetR/AcrR family transcriptional regulator